MTEKIIFSIEFTGLSEAEDDLALLTKRQRELRSELNKTKDDEAYLRLSAEMRKATEQANGLRAAIKSQKDEAKGINAATGSYIQLNAELVKLRRSYKELSEAERSGKVGQQMLKDVQALDTKLKAIDGTIGQFQRNVGNYKSAFDGFAGALLQVGAAFNIVNGVVNLLGSSIVTAAADFEQTSVSFEVMLGSAEKAVSLMEQLTEFAATTPFQQADIEGAARSLLAFGSDAENVTDELRMLGDVAAGTKQPLGEVALIYGKIRSQGRAQAEEINQLTERGILNIQKFSEQLNTTPEGLRKLASEGKVSFGDIQTYIQNATSEGGIFFNLMERQSKTTGGLISNMKDQFALLAREIGTALKPVIEATVGAFSGLSRLIRENIDLLVAATKVLATVAAGVGAYILSIRAAAVAQSAWTAVQKAWTVAQLAGNVALALFTGGIGKARVAMQAFNAVVKLNPIGLIVGAVTALTAAVVLFGQKTSEGAEKARALREQTDGLNSAFATEKAKLDNLFGALNEANKKHTDKSKIIAEIQTQYGAYIGNINLETASQEQLKAAYDAANTAIIAQVVAKQKAAAVDELSVQLVKQQIQLNEALAKQKEVGGDFLADEGTRQRQAQDLANLAVTGSEIAISITRARIAEVVQEFDAAGKALAQSLTQGEFNALAGTFDNVTEAATGTATATTKAVKETKDLSATLGQMRAELAKVKIQLDSYNNASEIPREVFEKYDDLIKKIAELEAQLIKFRGGQFDSIVNLQIRVEQGAAEKLPILDGATVDPALDARLRAEAAANARIEVERQMLETLQEQAISFAISTQEALFQMNEDDIEARKQQELNALEANYNRDIELAGANQAEIQRLTEERDAKRREIERKAFEDRKKNDAAELVMKGIIAAVQSWVNPGFPGAIVLSAIIAAQTAIGVATIMNKQFTGARGIAVMGGGNVQLGTVSRGNRHAQGGIKTMMHGTPVEIEGGEFVDMAEDGGIYTINRNSTAKYGGLLNSIAGRMFRGKGKMMSAINEAGGGIPLAEYGFNAPPMAQNYNSPTINVVNPAQDLSGIERALMNQRPVLVVKDVNQANQDIATVQVLKDF